MLDHMGAMQQRELNRRGEWYFDLRGKLILASLMYRDGQRWAANGAYVCSTLWDPSPSITCDGWTAGGEMLEVKFCGHVT